MQKIFPRSPYERLGGYVHLPRLIDKARLHRQGLLTGYNYKTVGFDRHLLAFLKVDPEAFEKAANELESDEAVLAWVRENGVTHSPAEIEKWNQVMISRRVSSDCVSRYRRSSSLIAPSKPPSRSPWSTTSRALFLSRAHGSSSGIL